MKKLLLALLLGVVGSLNAQYCPFLGPNQNLPCGVNSTTLTADLSQCGVGSNPNQTTNYNVTTIPYVAQTNTGTQITQFFSSGFANNDDGVSNVISLPFNFCFFGTSYNQVWIGTNGWVSFTGGQPTTFTSAAIPSAAANVPKNCIMGPWQDWHPGLGGQVRYQTQGVAPCRKFVVSWINVPMFSCTSTYGTFHIVLYESTNVIENYIQNKQYCAWAGGTAVQGLHNLPGNTAVVVPGRNSTVWTAQNDAKRYTPSGPVVTPTPTWYQVGNPNPIGTGLTITVTPPAGGANYTCHLEYPTCNAGWTTCNGAAGGLGPDTVFVAPGPPQLPPPNITTQDPHCNNGCDGIITVTPNGGTGVTTISWTGLGTNFTINNLCSGNYTFNLVDAAGCTYNGNATLLNPPPLQSPLFTNTNPTCFGYCDGTSTVNPIDGVGPYTYQWNNGQGNQTATNLCSGQQTVTVFDQYNCPATGTTTLVDPPMITINPITGLDTICFNSLLNTYNVTSVFPNMGYLWSTTIGSITSGQGTNQVNLDVNGVNGGNYTNAISVIGVSALGCQSLPQYFNIVDLDIIPIIDPIGPLCTNDICTNLTANPQGGLFSGSPAVLGNQFCPSSAYVVNNDVIYTYVQSGCTFDDTINVVVNPQPFITGMLPSNELIELCEGDSTSRSYTITSTLLGQNTWYVLSQTINSTSLNQTWNWGNAGTNLIEVTTTVNGCTSPPFTGYVNIVKCPEEVFYVPNSFTPDGDEHNNVFQPIFTSGFEPNSYHLLIYNRWGETIFESTDYQAYWDGTYNNYLCETGIYQYRIEFDSKYNAERKEIFGHVLILR